MPPGNPQGYQQQQGLPGWGQQQQFREPRPQFMQQQQRRMAMQQPWQQQPMGGMRKSPQARRFGGAGGIARPMNAGPQGFNPGQGAVPVSPRFNPGQGAPGGVSPPFQNFQNNWGPRTQGFQVPGSPVAVMGAQGARRNVGPNQGAPLFAPQRPQGGPGRFNKFI